MSVNARCILDELQDRYFGNNNGRICLTVEDAAEEIGRSYNTAKTAFWELEEKGFIERMLEGDYRKGKAREWRLTYEQYQGREPTDDWKNRIASSNFETAPSKNEG
ncbi:MAG: hypothetical protein R3D66_04685 [Alphaproteobacteria bacterium]